MEERLRFLFEQKLTEWVAELKTAPSAKKRQIWFDGMKRAIEQLGY